MVVNKLPKSVIFEARIPRLQIIYFTKVAQMLSSLTWLKYPVSMEIVLVKGLTLFYFTGRENEVEGFMNSLYGHIDWISLEKNKE